MESPNGIYLQTMNMTQVNERLKTNDLIIIPVGSTSATARRSRWARTRSS